MSIREFFSDDKGNLSSMRLMAFEVVQVGLFLAVWSVVRETVSVDIIAMAIGLVTLGLTGKAAQKWKGEEAPEE